jgi:hypothetical protein
MDEKLPPLEFVTEEEFYRRMGGAGFTVPASMAAAQVRRAASEQQEQELPPARIE